MLIQPILTYKGDTKNFVITVNIPSNSQKFAYYVYLNGKKVDTVWYKPIEKGSEILEFTYSPYRSGEYRFRIFFSDKNEEKTSYHSNSLILDLTNNNLVESAFKKERVFFADNPVKYILEEAKSKSDKLLIVFAGIHTQEYTGGPPVYNYFRTLQNIDVNKLFILDEYKGQFCYYLGLNSSFDFERSVISLIFKTANSLGISGDNIITCGSSKGGVSALYYALKYNLGSVICGAPATLIGDSMEARAQKNSLMKELYYKMTGEDVNLGKKHFNNLIFDLIESETKFPEFYFHIGNEDPYYQKYLQPVLDILDKKKINYSLDIKEYSDHSETGTYFAKYLVDTLNTNFTGKFSLNH